MGKVIMRLLANLGTAALTTVAVILGNPDTFTEFGIYAGVAAALGSLLSLYIGKIPLPEAQQ
jgi:hypothetical protein